MNRTVRFATAISLGLLVTVVSLAVSTAPAKSAVYWANGGLIGAVNLDGSGADPSYFNPGFEYPSIKTERPTRADCGIAVDDRYLYWLGVQAGLPIATQQISRVNLDGPTVIETIVTDLPLWTCDLTVNGSHIYWTYNDQSPANADAIGRANIDGSGVDDSFVSNITNPGGIAVDRQHIYWTSQSGIGRANLSGDQVEPHFLLVGTTWDVVATDRYLFWGGPFGYISRAGIDGTEVDEHFIPSERAGYLAVNASHLFWTNVHPNGQPPSTIGRASLDGGEVGQGWVATVGDGGLSGLAVDSRTSLPQIPLWSQPFSLGRIRHNHRNGAVFVDVWAKEGGELSVISPRIGWKVLKPRTGRPLESTVRWRLKLWPGRGEGSSRRLQAKLRATGRARITLRVFYRESGKVPRRERMNLEFRRVKHTR